MRRYTDIGIPINSALMTEGTPQLMWKGFFNEIISINEDKTE